MGGYSYHDYCTDCYYSVDKVRATRKGEGKDRPTETSKKQEKIR